MEVLPAAHQALGSASAEVKLGCVALRLSLSPLLGLLRCCFQQHSFFVAAFMDGQAVLINHAVLEPDVLSANPAEFCIFVT
jgi:hypothetical protein